MAPFFKNTGRIKKKYKRTGLPAKRIKASPELRRMVINKYGNFCILCLKNNDETFIELHHVDGDARNTIDENLIPLCRSCHRMISCNMKEFRDYLSSGAFFSEYELFKPLSQAEIKYLQKIEL